MLIHMIITRKKTERVVVGKAMRLASAFKKGFYPQQYSYLFYFLNYR